MTPTEDLFQLIKSMDRNEKGYFKKFASINGTKDSNYLRLFDAIDKQDKYDEKAVKALFKNEKFTAQLHVAKNYLYHLVLKSPRNYHQDATTSSKMYQMLMDAEVLVNRKMYDSALKTILKAKKLLPEEEPMGLAFKPILHKIFSRINTKNLLTEFTDEDLDNCTTEYLSDTEALTIHIQHEVLFERIRQLRTKIAWADTVEDKAKFDEIINHQLMKSDVSTKPFITQQVHYDTLCYYYMATRQHWNFLAITDSLVELEADRQNIPAGQRIATLYNNARANCLHLRFDKAEKSLTVLRDITATLPKDKALQQRCLVTMEMEMAIRNDRFDSLPVWLQNNVSHIQHFIEKELVANDVIHFKFGLSKLYVKTGNYSKALDYINMIIPTREGKMDVGYKFLWVPLIICNYEIGNQLVVPHLLKSMHAQFSKTTGYDSAEKLFVASMKLLHKTTKANEASLLKKLRNDIIAAYPDPYHLQLASNIDILNWLNQRLCLNGLEISE